MEENQISRSHAQTQTEFSLRISYWPTPKVYRSENYFGDNIMKDNVLKLLLASKQIFHRRKEVRQLLYQSPIYDDGIGEFIVTGNSLDTFIYFSPKNGSIALTNELKSSIEKLDNSYVFAAVCLSLK